MKIFCLIIIAISISMLQTSCGSLNKAHGELHYNNHVTKGQELIDLKTALENGAIDQNEYDIMKNRIIEDDYAKKLFNDFDAYGKKEDKKVSI